MYPLFQETEQRNCGGSLYVQQRLLHKRGTHGSEFVNAQTL